MIHCEHIHDPAALDELSTVWEKLYNNSGAEPSTSLEWTTALRDTHLSPTDKFFITLVKDADTPVAIVPFLIRQTTKMGITLRTLMPISELYNTHSDLLINNYSPELFEAIIGSLHSPGEEWDFFRIGNMLENHPLLLSLSSGSHKNIHAHTARTEPSYYTPLEDTFEQYLSNRSGKFRNYLKRMKKKLGEKGKMSFLSYSDYPTLSDAYDDLLTIEKSSWKHKHGTAISNISRQKHFYWLLSQGAAKRKRLHLVFLYLDQKPIAYNIGMISNNSYKYLKTSYDAAYRSSSPSTILRAHLIEKLINHGVREFDFPGEPYEWEAQWAKELRWHQSIIIYNKTAKSWLFSLYNWIKNTALKKNKVSAFNYHDPLTTHPEA